MEGEADASRMACKVVGPALDKIHDAATKVIVPALQQIVDADRAMRSGVSYTTRTRVQTRVATALQGLITAVAEGHPVAEALAALDEAVADARSKPTREIDQWLVARKQDVERRFERLA